MTSHSPIPEPSAQGYQMLADQEAAWPDNLFASDQNLQRTLEFYEGAEKYRAGVAALYRFGRIAARELDAVARSSNARENLPRADRFDHIGRRREQVAYHPDYHECGRLIYGSGVLAELGEPANNTRALALFYLSAQNGEAGHNCPVACGAGAIKILQKIGLHPDQQARAEEWLERLLDPDYATNFTGAQFVTEVQGGSDVGANGTLATPLDSAAGSWLLNGRKWFCSNVTADLALVVARVAGQGEGTRGLGLFAVPRLLDDGSLNGLYIERLKEKLGTSSLASAECEFRDAVAWQVGDVRHGIHYLMQHVINTSRIYNAAGTAAHARRAYLTAWSYAQPRRAFGGAIITFPLVQDILTKMRSDATALTSGLFHITRLLDEAEAGTVTDETEAILRTAINLNKYRSAVISHEVINHGIELLGGNGAIETFSVLPRLLRDNVVYENWEGPHNVLMAQLQRDFRRYRHHEPFLRRVRALFAGLATGELRVQGMAAADQISAELDAILQLEELEASVYFRPLMDRLADLFYTGCMAVEGGWELLTKQDRTKQRLAWFYFHRRVVRTPLAQWREYPTWIGRLCHEIRPGRIHRDRDRLEEMDDPFQE
jgi:alkylation response protein AidB-like acyl-CoA dehydrogenase